MIFAWGQERPVRVDLKDAHVGFVSGADLPYVDLATTAHDTNLSVLRELHRVATHGASE